LEPSKKLDKFLLRVNALLDTLDREHENRLINRGVDRYYYIQKKEELILLREGVEEAGKKARGSAQRVEFFKKRLANEYQDVFSAWKKDVRWVNRVLTDKTRDDLP
jgi:hypothetical protein